ncbi:oxidoreductase [Myceligenerans indicum]|uniref:SDR family oxidoreductase n=1 Tax=Myceligenerans indicum TaxID=2593663 RepID=A0ABS1LI85_9MICO|nr:oxidoreductase [Myceligenerans indicum]MBL0885931.1 SDR family oxidoreductase [Myceligenerans indicum]
MTAWTTSDIPDQTGRTAIVTGANSGLGLVTATELARHGADVVLAVRNTTTGEEAAAAIGSVAPHSRVTVRALDLASLDSVREFSARTADEHEHIDLLVNNAGVVILGPRHTTADGFELHLGTNHLGHYALTGLLLPLLERGSTPRIVTLSSLSHKTAHLDLDDLMLERTWDASAAYGASKLANTMFGIELDRRLRSAGSPIMSLLAHPGISRSNLTPRAWADRGPVGRLTASLFLALMTQPTAQGALPQLHAATAPGVQGGQFFGPAGRNERRGEVAEVQASADSHDVADGRRLWEASAALTGVTYLQGPPPGRRFAG